MLPINDSTLDIVAQAKTNLERFSDRLLHLLSYVPDDKLTWSPSSTAKSALRIVTHCALTSKFCSDVITGNMPDKMPPAEEFLGDLTEAEATITTRAGAIDLVKKTTSDLKDAISTVNADNIDSTPDSPFGPVPLRFWIFQGGEQMAGHSGQLEYLQTIWGDLDNHYG